MAHTFIRMTLTFKMSRKRKTVSYPFFFFFFFLFCFLYFVKAITITRLGNKYPFFPTTLRKHAYSNILKISPPKTESFKIKVQIFFMFLLKTWIVGSC